MAQYVDQFTRPDGPLQYVPNTANSVSYVQYNGTWSVVGGKAFSAAAGTSNPMALIAGGSGNFDIALSVGTGDAIYARVHDGSNWLRARYYGYNTTTTTPSSTIIGYEQKAVVTPVYDYVQVPNGTHQEPVGAPVESQLTSAGQNWLYDQYTSGTQPGPGTQSDPNNQANGNLTHSGPEPFGHNRAGVNTDWNSSGTQGVLWVRKEFPVVQNTTSMRVRINVDDTAQIFVNGDEITGGSASAIGTYDFTASAATLAKAVLGRHVVAVRARDTGGTSSFLGIQVFQSVQQYQTVQDYTLVYQQVGTTTTYVDDLTKPIYAPGTATVTPTYRLYMERCVNGVVSDVAPNIAIGAISTLRFSGNGTTLSVYADGTYVMGANDSTFANEAQHGFGYAESVNNLHSIDNFTLDNGAAVGGGTIVTQDAPTLVYPINSTAVDRSQPVRLTQTYSPNATSSARSKLDQEWRVAVPLGQPTNTATQASSTGPLNYIEYPANTFPSGAIEWRGRDYDVTGTQGSWSSWAKFIASTPAANAVITSPISGSTVGNVKPVLTWSVSNQASYRVVVRNTSTNAVLADSGVVYSVDTRSYVMDQSAYNNTQVTVSLTITNPDGIASPDATVTFTASFTPPTKADATVAAVPALAAISVAPINFSGSVATASNNIWMRVQGTALNTAVQVGKNVLPGQTFLYRFPASGVEYAFRVDAVGSNGAITLGDWLVGTGLVSAPPVITPTPGLLPANSFGEGAYGAGVYGS